ncbi:TRAP transporter small permease [Aureimonas fodinaquatilis]|uniref:TRAP transporter small permease protein n=1 Tax=Aureimonas fodinaquatilis TaxID=2565783 RepID=A0A5B0DU95_9HYPH|nr:TRAP transporter small permease [Aureimonas fodinaquatilis]KAA0970334.1 TRAP transporter small permease [Aureimonas fodinaquatilis]
MISLVKFLRYVSCIALLAVAIVMSLEATLRYVFRAPIFGVQDLLSAGLLVVFSLGLADSWLSRSHVRMDMLYDNFSPTLRKIVDYISLFIAAIMGGALVYGAYKAMFHYAGYGASTPLLNIPISWLAAIVVFGAACFCLAIVYDFYLKLTGRDIPPPPPTLVA